MVNPAYITFMRRMREQFNTRSPKNACSSCSTPHCCDMLVTVTKLECLAIIQEHPELVELLREPLTAQARVEIDSASTAVYFAKRQPCAFLQGGRCAIYPVRPIGCLCVLAPEGWETELCGERNAPTKRLSTDDARNAFAKVDALEAERASIEPDMYVGIASGILHVLGDCPDAIIVNANTLFTDSRILGVLEDEFKDMAHRVKEGPQ